jgi:hypothetical protein|tara:strand:+ start:1793 stop:2056 length:264 start_codon:yes stop_codon:yes gene_type:complete
MSRDYPKFNPSTAPSNPVEISRYLDNTLVQIKTSLDIARDGHLEVVYAEPDKPYQGDIRYADGTSWNPGGTGEGIYFYNAAGAWVKL